MLQNRPLRFVGFSITALLVLSMASMLRLLGSDEDALRAEPLVAQSIHAKSTDLDASRRTTQLSQKISWPPDPVEPDHTASLSDDGHQSDVKSPAPQQESDIFLSAKHDQALPANIVLASKEGGASFVRGAHTLTPKRDSDALSAEAVALSKPVQSTNGQHQGNATHGRIPQSSALIYGTKVREALARHKPNGGRDGSAAVSFEIDTSGALRRARISQSSGNKQVDRMALATVRGAAPFPTPPASLKGEELSYAIRIHFP